MGSKSFALAIFSLLTASSLCNKAINITVDSALQASSSCEADNLMVTCVDLDSAISYTTSLELNTSSSSQISTLRVSIHLHSGTHYITKQSHFGDASVSFLGVGSGVDIVCDYNETVGGESSLNHTWYFNQSDTVRVDNLQFRDCIFPFRMFAVGEVEITNSSFM